MSERLVYEFQMTSEFARTATDTLERALWVQNERLYHHLENRMRFRSHLPSVGMILSTLGLLLVLFGWTLAPQKRLIFAPMFAAFAGLLLTFVFISSIARALRRFARRAVASTARRSMMRVAKRAPYTIQYELADGVLRTRVVSMGISKSLDLRKVRMAVETPAFICAFHRPLAQSPIRILYLPGAPEHRALCAELARTGTRIEHLPGAGSSASP